MNETLLDGPALLSEINFEAAVIAASFVGCILATVLLGTYIFGVLRGCCCCSCEMPTCDTDDWCVCVACKWCCVRFFPRLSVFPNWDLRQAMLVDMERIRSEEEAKTREEEEDEKGKCNHPKTK